MCNNKKKMFWQFLFCNTSMEQYASISLGMCASGCCGSLCISQCISQSASFPWQRCGPNKQAELWHRFGEERCHIWSWSTTPVGNNGCGSAPAPPSELNFIPWPEETAPRHGFQWHCWAGEEIELYRVEATRLPPTGVAAAGCEASSASTICYLRANGSPGALVTCCTVYRMALSC